MSRTGVRLAPQRTHTAVAPVCETRHGLVVPSGTMTTGSEAPTAPRRSLASGPFEGTLLENDVALVGEGVSRCATRVAPTPTNNATTSTGLDHVRSVRNGTCLEAFSISFAP